MDADVDRAPMGRDALERFHIFDGCYEAHRAAELAGVPKSTVYDWARKGVIVPSISETRIKLWSYADLMALRITYWLRKPKGDVRATPMRQVRSALDQLEGMDLRIWDPDTATSPVLVDRRGVLHLRQSDGSIADLDGRVPIDESWLDPLQPFGEAGLRGPDLIRPRPHLRIVPGKVSGEPHLLGSRLTTLTVSALSRRGFPLARIIEMYPHEDQEGIREAIDLEQEITQAAA